MGDTVHVTIEQDTEPRVVEVPQELQTALDKDPQAREHFDAMAYTYRKKYARWIAGAKREDTRERRLKQAIEKLSRGERL